MVMRTVDISEDEWYPVYGIVPEGQGNFQIDLPDDFVLRYALLLEQFQAAQRYIGAVSRGEVITS